ncbi:hypothetical protein DXZ75_05030 [Streptomyces sp. AcE210]|nr:hypothetical protein DXZ75_05030 [Streptomyces sp. AcE210]
MSSEELRGSQLTSHEVIANSIAATTTRTGLTVEDELETRTYNTGVKVADAEIDALAMSQHRFRSNWITRFIPPKPTATTRPGLKTGRSSPSTTSSRGGSRRRMPAWVSWAGRTVA